MLYCFPVSHLLAACTENIQRTQHDPTPYSRELIKTATWRELCKLEIGGLGFRVSGVRFCWHLFPLKVPGGFRLSRTPNLGPKPSPKALNPKPYPSLKFAGPSLPKARLQRLGGRVGAGSKEDDEVVDKLLQANVGASIVRIGVPFEGILYAKVSIIRGLAPGSSLPSSGAGNS